MKIDLIYEGTPWTAELLHSSDCHIHFKNPANPTDGMTWSAPTESMSDLAWRIYHTNYEPTRAELFSLLAVVDSFRSIIFKDHKRRYALLGAFREILKADYETESNESK